MLIRLENALDISEEYATVIFARNMASVRL
jgi:hypothetical protein